MTGSPAPWLVSHEHLLPSAGSALDVACGHGRHALWLAQRGLAVEAIDRDVEAVAHVSNAAERLGLRITVRVVDLEGVPPPSFGATRADVVLVFNYLHRPLFPSLVDAVAVGGLLVYETFTRAQALRGRPTNPDYLLEPGELRARVHPLAILDEREGIFEGRCVASVIAKKLAG